MRNLLAGLRVVHFDPNECGLVFVFWDVLLHETATARLDLLHDLDGHIHLFLPGAGLVRFPVTVDDLGELLVAGMLMFVETATKDDARRVRVLQEGDVGELVGRLLLGLSALDRHHLLAGELDGLGELLGVFLLDATALFQPSQVPFNKDVAILIDREMVSVDPECHQRVQAFRWRGAMRPKADACVLADHCLECCHGSRHLGGVVAKVDGRKVNCRRRKELRCRLEAVHVEVVLLGELLLLDGLEPDAGIVHDHDNPLGGVVVQPPHDVEEPPVDQNPVHVVVVGCLLLREHDENWAAGTVRLREQLQAAGADVDLGPFREVLFVPQVRRNQSVQPHHQVTERQMIQHALRRLLGVELVLAQEREEEVRRLEVVGS
mmetsp:Transcript_23133/g.65547  ORF Transcript_23133/g.65547 Transcript_23133/m.65547 type:complete len:377 (+) Transcript_23133:588-1718(+)